MQVMGLYPANSMFIGDYLTTPGQAPHADLEMIRDAGFVLEAPDGSPLGGDPVDPLEEETAPAS
jgi:biotin synthase